MVEVGLAVVVVHAGASRGRLHLRRVRWSPQQPAEARATVRCRHRELTSNINRAKKKKKATTPHAAHHNAALSTPTQPSRALQRRAQHNTHPSAEQYTATHNTAQHGTTQHKHKSITTRRWMLYEHNAALPNFNHVSCFLQLSAPFKSQAFISTPLLAQARVTPPRLVFM